MCLCVCMCMLGYTNMWHICLFHFIYDLWVSDSLIFVSCQKFLGAYGIVVVWIVLGLVYILYSWLGYMQELYILDREDIFWRHSSEAPMKVTVLLKHLKQKGNSGFIFSPNYFSMSRMGNLPPQFSCCWPFVMLPGASRVEGQNHAGGHIFATMPSDLSAAPFSLLSPLLQAVQIHFAGSRCLKHLFLTPFYLTFNGHSSTRTEK